MNGPAVSCVGTWRLWSSSCRRADRAAWPKGGPHPLTSSLGREGQRLLCSGHTFVRTFTELLVSS